MYALSSEITAAAHLEASGLRTPVVHIPEIKFTAIEEDRWPAPIRTQNSGK